MPRLKRAMEYFRGHYLPNPKDYLDWRASPLLASRQRESGKIVLSQPLSEARMASWSSTIRMVTGAAGGHSVVVLKMASSLGGSMKRRNA